MSDKHDSREAFEAWAKRDNMPHGFNLRREEVDTEVQDYADWHTDAAYQGWNAALDWMQAGDNYKKQLDAIVEYAKDYIGCRCGMDDCEPGDCWPCRMMYIINLADPEHYADLQPTWQSCRDAFESRYVTELDKRALQVDDNGQYILMSTYNAWVNFQLGWEAKEAPPTTNIKEGKDGE